MQKNRPDKRLIPLSCTGKEWPSRDACLGYLGTQKLAPDIDALFELYGPQSKISHIPVSFQYMLLTQAFWDAEGPKDFHMPDIIVTTSDRTQHTGYLPKTEVSRDSEFLQAHKNTVARFDERVAMWTESTNRIPFPWIQEWSTTPWGEIKRRGLVDEFRRQFKNRNELACHDISAALLAMFQPGDPEALPVPGSRDNNDWLFGVIGLIMKAAIPIRYKSYFFFKEIDWLRAWPAQQARAAGKNFSLWAADGDWGSERIPKTEVSHPVTGSDIEDPDHHTFLDAAEHLMAVVDRTGADQPAIWVETLQRAIRMLRRMRDEYSDEESWADVFPWQVPDYDGALYVRWIPGKHFNEPFPTKYEYVD
ncbi:hypothetical protein F4809DRAFT_299099 [Biscogniauxia mediterranea]|nr:hypothetical protein F4809DRAFT_299099 [Biscogniauxia mediterranea]